MSFLHLSTRELRAPEAEVLPDSRKRLTRFLAVTSTLQQPAEIDLDYGVVDTGTAPTGWDGLRLIRKLLTDDLLPPGRDTRPYLQLVFEQIPESAEIQVGSNTRIKLEDGREAIEAEFLQFSTGIYVPGTVGTTTAPGDSSAYLKESTQTNDGTLRRIKRIYVYAGTIATDDQSLNNGALLKKVIVSVKTVPSTPSGFTLVGSPAQNPNGLPVYTYTYYKGNGETGREIAYGQSDDQGTTGSTTIAITHLTAASVTTDPTSTPGAGFTKVTERKRDDDGHRVWIVTWAKGAGLVVDDKSVGNGGKFVAYHRVALGAAPSTPAATIGGTVAAVTTNRRKADGYDIYDYSWEEGIGETGRTSSDDHDGKLQRVVITHLTALSVSSQPTSDPLSGGAAIVTGKRDVDGHRVWEVTWVKGSGEVSRRSSDDAGGKLQRVVITHLTATSVTSQPTSDPLSGGVAIVTGQTDDAGHRVWEVTWAKGVGEVGRRNSDRFSGMLQRVVITHLTATSVTTQPTSDPLSGGTKLEDDYRDEAGHRVWTVVWTKANTTSFVTNSTRKANQGKLVVYRRSKFGAAPAAPSATIGGTVVETDTGEQLEDGYTLYFKEWAEGVGTIENSQQLRNQGKLVIYRQRALGTAPSAPSATIGGTVVLTRDDSRDDSGVTIYDREWAEGKGRYSRRTQPRDGGLRLETWESLGASYDASFMKPDGILMAKDDDDLDGATRWTVTCMQKSDGTAMSLPETVLTFGIKHPFDYPGRAKVITTTLETNPGYDVYKSPPVRVLIDATVEVSYKTTAAIGTLANTLWNPTEWTTIFAKFRAYPDYWPRTISESLPGYRAISTTAVNHDGGLSGAKLVTVLGERCAVAASGTPFSIQLAGGPANPEGNTYTIAKPELEPAFIGYDGTQYYRLTVIYATIPAQPSLPV